MRKKIVFAIGAVASLAAATGGMTLVTNTVFATSAGGSRKQQIIINVVNRRTHPAPYPNGKRTSTNDPKNGHFQIPWVLI